MAAFLGISDQDASPTAHAAVLSTASRTDEVTTEFMSLSLEEKYPTLVIVGRVISTVVLTIGFPGNFLSAWIWLRLTIRDKISSGVYLTALAISDSVFLTAYLLQLLYFLWEVRLLSCPYTFAICYIALMSSHYLSVLLILAFNVDRFLAITYPFKVSLRAFLIMQQSNAPALQADIMSLTGVLPLTEHSKLFRRKLVATFVHNRGVHGNRSSHGNETSFWAISWNGNNVMGMGMAHV